MAELASEALIFVLAPWRAGKNLEWMRAFGREGRGREKEELDEGK